jgi:DNA-binding LytR/AlgR family response regulator
MNEGLRILVVHPSPPIARSIVRDIKRLGLRVSAERKAATVQEAQEAITTLQPHILFLGLDIPNAGAVQLLEEYPPAHRDFAVILIDAGGDSPRERQHHVHIVMQQHIAGYLLLGAFDNEILGQSIERALNHLQQRLFEERHREIVEFLLHTTLAQHHAASAATTDTTTTEPSTAAATRATMPEARIALLLPAEAAARATTDRVLDWERVIRLQTFENYYELVMFDAEGFVKKLTVRKRALSADELPPSFTKIHRSHIVNLRHVLTLQHNMVYMACGTSIKLPKTQQARVRELLQQFSQQVNVLDILRSLVWKTPV